MIQMNLILFRLKLLLGKCMLVANVLNLNKKGKIQGSVFHLFYPDIHTSILFDKDMSEAIIFGSKNIVMTQIKKLDVLMGVPPTTKVKIYSYITSPDGYRRTDTYYGNISLIGKYIKHI